MSPQFIREHDEYVELHRDGLRRIVGLRGGLSTGDIRPQTQYAITLYVLQSPVVFKFEAKQAHRAEMTCNFAIRRRKAPFKADTMQTYTLEYPTHPFSPGLCSKISTLPRGFSEMALEKVFSLQVINLLLQFSKAFDRGPEAFEWNSLVVVETMRLCTQSEASALEKSAILLSHTFGRYFRDIARVDRGLRPTAHLGENFKQMLLDLSRSIFSPSTKYQEFVIWGVAVLAATFHHNGLEEGVQDDLFRQLFQRLPLARKREKVLAIVNKFFFHPSLAGRLEALWLQKLERCLPG